MSDSQMTHLAYEAERELKAKQRSHGKRSDSTLESGVDAAVETHFPGASVEYGPEATGRIIPPSHGGSELKCGRMTRDYDFEGPGGPEDKERLRAERRGGDDDIPTGQQPKGMRREK